MTNNECRFRSLIVCLKNGPKKSFQNNGRGGKQSLSEFKSCEHTHFDHLLRSATLLHFMTMEYITSNKGGRKLAFENNIYIKQRVLSIGTVWGDIMGGFCPGGFCPRGDFVQGDFVRRILSGGILSQNPYAASPFQVCWLNLQVCCLLQAYIFKELCLTSQWSSKMMKAICD